MAGRQGQRASTRDPEYETRMELAVTDLADGTYRTIKAAAKAHKVARQTLSDRVKGIHKARHQAYKHSQLLNEAQENVVNEWLVQNSGMAAPLHPRDLRARVFEITGKLAGKNWHRKYLKRHNKPLKASKPHHLDPKRAQNFNRTNVDGYFRLRAQIEKQYNGIPPEHNWNEDEKAEDKECYRQHSDNLELVTILECASAAGDIMPPYFVLKDGLHPDTRDPAFDGMGGFAVSPTGWTDRDIFEHWFTTVFVPEAEKSRVDPEKPIVLTLDGHDSHETRKLKRAAFDHNIIIIALPSKTTHKLQPLDVGVFSSVQRQWSKHCDERLAQGVRITRFNFIPEYLATRPAITRSLIQKAFAKTGIYPLNPTIFHERDFAPSQASSSTATFPPSYPQEIPSSPSYIPSELGTNDSDPDWRSEGEDSDDSSESKSSNELHDDDRAPLTPSSSTNRITRSVSTTLGRPTVPPIPPYGHVMGSEHREIWAFMRSYKSQCEIILDERTAQLDAANAHCTITRHQNEALTKQLANKSQSKRRKSKKVLARFVTLPESRVAFEAEEAELDAKEKAEIVKAAKKKADDTARALRINQEISSRVFDCPLASYKRKDDLVALAGALALPMEGTIVELTKVIKDHLAENPSRTNEPRFSGLFASQAGGSRKRAAAVASSSEVAGEPSMPSLPQSSASTNDASVPNLSNHRMSDFPSAGESSNSHMSHTHIPYTLLSHNAPSMPHLPYHTYSHIDYHVNSSYYKSGETPFN